MQIKVRNHKILNQPIAALVLLMFWGYFFYQIIGSLFLLSLGDYYVGYGSAFGAIIALIIHKAWFSPEFKGSIGIPKFHSRDLKIIYILFAVMTIGIDLIPLVGNKAAFSFVSLGSALMAGIGEEMFVRALPISVMMRDWMDEKHIPFIAYSTAIIFGLIHFTNMIGGAPLVDTLAQVVIAIGMGVMFSALYLRSGNILLCMLLHTVHDMLNFMLYDVTDSIWVSYDLITSIIIGVISIAVGTYLIRKSVRADIVMVWKERWNQD